MNNSIDDALGIMPVTEIKTEVVKVEESTEIDSELEKVRENIAHVAATGQSALEELVALAATAEDARAYETLATLMMATLRANRDLIDYQKEKKKLLDKKETSDTPKITNNVQISAKDLLDKYVEMKEANDKTIDNG